MKIEKISLEATIPCSQYANIRPTIEMSDVSIEEATKKGMELILPLFAKYSEKGELVPKELLIATVGKKKSFNEDVEIGFEPVQHIYTYQDKPLVSATDYVKKFYKEFDADTISAILASKWGVPEQSIRELWKENGEITSAFGTAIHEALEFYEKHKDIGEVISSKKEEEKNYALPKHPVLRKIVEEFVEMNKGEVGKVITEALLSNVELGICGTTDRLVITDEKKKECIIKDYKINVGAEESDKNYKALPPFDKLPQNKITKYQIQMSIYANLLEKSGWTVKELEVDVYEESWKKFVLPVLKVI